MRLNLTFPDSFFDEEVRDDYLVTSETKMIWAVLLDLLNEFQKVCDKHKLRWWADGGTLLGAVRHKGMIPWDDDIDVMMFREDYNKLCEIGTKEFHYPYFFQTEETDKGSIRGHIQIRNSETTAILNSEWNQKYPFNQGIFIDVFPLDNIPDNDDDFQKIVVKANNFKNRARHIRNNTLFYHFRWDWNIFRMAKSILRYFIFSICFKYEKVYGEFQTEIQKYKGIPTKRICKLVLFPVKMRRVWLREWFDGTRYMSFETLKVPVPSGYVEILNTFYGDWKVFKKGENTHGGCFFDVTKPYTDYI